MIEQLGRVADPQQALKPWLIRDNFILCLTWDLEEAWLTPKKNRQLWALLIKSPDSLECVISDQMDLMSLTSELKAAEDLSRFLSEKKLRQVNLSKPLPLDPIFIPKPWGQEIWLTGIEERGVCCVAGIPLPWVLSLAPELIAGQRFQAPILLKVLDPLPDEVIGDLYFEMHEQKQEVYVVTHIDKTAWPGGEGAIKLGFDPELVSDYGNREVFLSAYQTAVEHYQEIRNEIDNRLDRFKMQQSMDTQSDLPSHLKEVWIASLPPALLDEEVSRRKAMDRFVHLKRLIKGDVITVPPLLPHSLQHGVRVIEFQSPHYERYILSFAQKVLTQDHWDTTEALKKAELMFTESPCTLIHENEGCRVEEIVAFEPFKVWRVQLDAGACYNLDYDTYCLIAGLEGQSQIAEATLVPERALYVSALTGALQVENQNEGAAIFLVAFPSEAIRGANPGQRPAPL